MEKQKILHRRNSSKTKSKNCRKGQNWYTVPRKHINMTLTFMALQSNHKKVINLIYQGNECILYTMSFMF
jgi:hypothetical protein